MVWPDSITFVFKLKSNNENIENLMIFFNILAHQKNNYTIGPLITDINGKIIVTKDIINTEIETMLKEYPMDYRDKLESLNEIQVIVNTKNQIKDRILRLEKFYPESAKEIQKMLNKAKYFPDKEFKEVVLIIPQMHEIIIEIF